MGAFHFTPFPELTTDRLTLRQLRLTDNHDIFLLRSDEAVNRYLDRPWQKTIKEANDFIDWINQGIQRDKWLYWAITFREGARMLGTICLWNFTEDGTTADVGYEMNPAYCGRGIMDEALKAVLDFGFQTLELEVVQAFTHKDNDRSTRLLLRNGFVLDEAYVVPHNPDYVRCIRSRAPV